MKRSSNLRITVTQTGSATCALQALMYREEYLSKTGPTMEGALLTEALTSRIDC
jgi:hypothetical protein